MTDRFFYQHDKLAIVISADQTSSLFHTAALALAERHVGITPARPTLLAVERHNSVLNSGSPQCYTVYGFNFRVTPPPLAAFNGEHRDVSTMCYLLGNGTRSFSPALMRFCCPDLYSPFDAGGLNAYAYCEGDPINYIDPTGRIKTTASIHRRSPTQQIRPSVIVSSNRSANAGSRESVIRYPARQNSESVNTPATGTSNHNQTSMTNWHDNPSLQTRQTDNNSISVALKSAALNLANPKESIEIIETIKTIEISKANYDKQASRYSLYRASLGKKNSLRKFTPHQIIIGLALQAHNIRNGPRSFAMAQGLSLNSFASGVRTLDKKMKVLNI